MIWRRSISPLSKSLRSLKINCSKRQRKIKTCWVWSKNRRRRFAWPTKPRWPTANGSFRTGDACLVPPVLSETTNQQRLSKQIATNPHDAKGGKYPGKLQLQPNIWGNPKLNLPRIFHNPKLLELYRNGYSIDALGPLEQPGGRRFHISQKIDIHFQCVIKGIIAFKSNQEKWQWNVQTRLFFRWAFPGWESFPLL